MRRRALLALAGTSLTTLSGCLGNDGHDPIEIGGILVESAVPAAQTATVEVDDEETTVYEETVSFPAAEYSQARLLAGYPRDPGLYTVRCTYDQSGPWIEGDGDTESGTERETTGTSQSGQWRDYQSASHQQRDWDHNSSEVTADYTETGEETCYSFNTFLGVSSRGVLDADMRVSPCHIQDVEVD
jgi:hypothetical protein